MEGKKAENQYEEIRLKMLHILKHLIHKDYRRHKVLQIDDKVLHIFYANITKDVSVKDTSFFD